MTNNKFERICSALLVVTACIVYYSSYCQYFFCQLILDLFFFIPCRSFSEHLLVLDLGVSTRSIRSYFNFVGGMLQIKLISKIWQIFQGEKENPFDNQILSSPKTLALLLNVLPYFSGGSFKTQGIAKSATRFLRILAKSPK